MHHQMAPISEITNNLIRKFYHWLLQIKYDSLPKLKRSSLSFMRTWLTYTKSTSFFLILWPFLVCILIHYRILISILYFLRIFLDYKNKRNIFFRILMRRVFCFYIIQHWYCIIIDTAVLGFNLQLLEEFQINHCFDYSPEKKENEL